MKVKSMLRGDSYELKGTEQLEVSLMFCSSLKAENPRGRAHLVEKIFILRSLEYEVFERNRAGDSQRAFMKCKLIALLVLLVVM